MDQVKIGRFIAACRKKQQLTQMQLAEKLGITDRAVSKWETGKAMPDSALMLDLCRELNISVNELLNGETIDMQHYDEATEKILLEMAEKEEKQNKRLMTSMWTILITVSIFYVGLLLLAAYTLKEGALLSTIICGATVVFLIAGFIALKFEVDAGYYECNNCLHKFTPTYKAVMLAPHLSTTRYLKCPECHKRTWAKKVLHK